jgi:hypothetical protein
MKSIQYIDCVWKIQYIILSLNWYLNDRSHLGFFYLFRTNWIYIIQKYISVFMISYKNKIKAKKFCFQRI